MVPPYSFVANLFFAISYNSSSAQ